jgi:YD repeat-containing protein
VGVQFGSIRPNRLHVPFSSTPGRSRGDRTNPDCSTWTLRRIYTYDDNGRLVEERHERGDGSLVRTRQPIYTVDGRRIEEQRFAPRSGGSCCADSIAVDGSNDSFVVPATARRGRIMYDVRGAPIDITFKGRLGVTVGKIVFESDTAGRTTAVRLYGETEGWVESEAPWPVKLFLGWAARRILNGWARWNLVRRGRWRTLGHSVLWGPLWFERFTRYDAAGRRVEERSWFVGVLETIQTWNYDADGRLVEHVDRDETGNVTTREEYTYELDAVGNWVRRTIRRPQRPQCPEEMIDTTKRIIDYFD